jgi:hypothetical protein
LFENAREAGAAALFSPPTWEERVMGTRVTAVLGAAALLAAIAALPAGAEPRPAASCTNVSGTVSAIGIPVISGGTLVGFNVIGTGSTGQLGGAVNATLTVERALPSGTLHLSGTHNYGSSPAGAIAVSDRLVVTPSGHITNTSKVVSGGTGFLHTAGTLNPTTGVVQLDYHGRICN